MGKKRDTRKLEYAVTSIRQRYGPDAVRRGAQTQAVSVISTGYPELDAATGIGGLPRGRLSVLAGRATCGKRTLAAHVLATAQRGNVLAVYVDVLGTCDADMLSRAGVNMSNLLIARPADGRQALDMLGVLVDRPGIAAIVFDAWSDLDPGETVRLAAAALDALPPRLERSRAVVIVIAEQQGQDQGPDREALEQSAALRLKFRRREWLRRAGGPDVLGYRVEVEVEKNKLARAGGRAVLDLSAEDFEAQA